MKSVIRWLARLYPASWRGRYGNEFDALLEDVRPNLRDSLDVLTGALKMQMTASGFGKIAALFGLAGALLGAAASFAMPVGYDSQAVVRLRGKDANAAFVHDLAQRVLTRDALTKEIQTNGMYASERSSKPIEDIVEIMKGKIVIEKIVIKPSVQRDENIFVVRFRDADRFLAQRVVQDLVGRLIDENLRSRPGWSATVDLLDPPSLPQRPITPARLNIIATGLLAGLLSGALVATWRRRAFAQ
jgi:uncharacterized protein involved in exopolysaccharide biosynthesis